MNLRSSPSGRRITAAERNEVLVYSTELGSWRSAALVNLLPGAPLYDVMAAPFSASNDLAADDTHAIARAIDAANARPGVIFLGQRHRITGNLPEIRNNNVAVVGRGPFDGGTILELDNGPSGFGIRATGCQYPVIADLWIVGARAYTMNLGIRISACFRARVSNVLVSRMGRGVEIDKSALVDCSRVNLADIYGPFAHYAHGDPSAFNHAVKYRDCVVGTDYPRGLVGNNRLWSPSTLYPVGAVVKANDNLYQCVVSGTSSSSGTGPSGLPTTDIATLRSLGIVDGTAEWVFAMPACPAFKMGSYAHTFELLDCGSLQFDSGLSVADDSPGQGSAPQFCRSMNFQVDHPFGSGIELSSGVAHRHHNVFVTSVLEGSAITIAANNWEFVGGEIYGSARAGFVVNSGHGLIEGMQVGSIGSAAVNTRDGCEVAPGVTDFTIANCSFGRVARSLSPNSRYGISVGAGADNYILSNNRCIGNRTGGILNTPGTSTTRLVVSNIGSVSP